MLVHREGVRPGDGSTLVTENQSIGQHIRGYGNEPLDKPSF